MKNRRHACSSCRSGNVELVIKETSGHVALALSHGCCWCEWKDGKSLVRVGHLRILVIIATEFLFRQDLYWSNNKNALQRCIYITIHIQFQRRHEMFGTQWNTVRGERLLTCSFLERKKHGERGTPPLLVWNVKKHGERGGNFSPARLEHEGTQ